MKLLVCGSRTVTDKAWVFGELERFVKAHGEPEYVMHGAARGADSLGQEWARLRGIEDIPYPAQWEKNGKKAGIVRNVIMARNLDEADYVMAFVDKLLEESRGTADMVHRAREVLKKPHVLVMRRV